MERRYAFSIEWGQRAEIKNIGGFLEELTRKEKEDLIRDIEEYTKFLKGLLGLTEKGLIAWTKDGEIVFPESIKGLFGPALEKILPWVNDIKTDFSTIQVEEYLRSQIRENEQFLGFLKSRLKEET